MIDNLKVIHEKNTFVLACVWILYLLNLVLYYTLGYSSILYLPVETVALILITVLVLTKKWPSFSMYLFVTCMYIYLFILINKHPLLINYTYVWIVLIICSIYRSYRLILLASTFSLIFTIYSFQKYSVEIFSYISDSYSLYFILYGFIVSGFLLVHTRYTENLLTNAKNSNEKLNTILESVEIFTWSWDKSSSIITCSNEATRFFNITKESFYTNIYDITPNIHPDDFHIVENALVNLKSGSPQKIEYRVFDKDNILRWIQNRIVPIKDENGNIIKVDGVIIDITDRKFAEEKVNFLAYHDNLTGLPNRHLLNNQLSKAIIHAKSNGTKFALLFIDMDNLKKINDKFGHDIGDLAIREFSKRIKSVIGINNTICRMGGDEFITLIKDLDDDNFSDNVNDIVSKIHTSLLEPLQINKTELLVTASVGTSIFPEDGFTIKELIKNADINMYLLKNKRIEQNT